MKLMKKYTGDALMALVGEKVKVTFSDGEAINGTVVGFTSQHDSGDGTVHFELYVPGFGYGIDVSEEEITDFISLQNQRGGQA